jgi:hypothetical protein
MYYRLILNKTFYLQQINGNQNGNIKSRISTLTTQAYVLYNTTYGLVFILNLPMEKSACGIKSQLTCVHLPTLSEFFNN